VKKITVRLANEQDVPKFMEWIFNTPKNLFDPDVMSYPSTRTLVAVDEKDQPILFQPFQPVFMVESLAHKQGSSPREIALSLDRMDDVLEKLAQTYGIRELMFMSNEPSIIEFAQHHGYEVIKWTVLRKKLSPPKQ
jgi:hypothetical protein